MTTTSYRRPFFAIEVPKWYFFYRKINWLWWLQRIPMFLLAIPASFGVAGFSSSGDKLPIIIAYLAGFAFESTYIGTIALGDQMTDDDTFGRILWLFLNIAAVFASALFSTLYFSNGKYALITAESVTHGVLLPVVNFLYGFLLHHTSARENKVAKDLAEQNKEHCEYCNIGKANRNAVFAHYRYCPDKLAGMPKQFTTDGKPL